MWIACLLYVSVAFGEDVFVLLGVKLVPCYTMGLLVQSSEHCPMGGEGVRDPIVEQTLST